MRSKSRLCIVYIAETDGENHTSRIYHLCVRVIKTQTRAAVSSNANPFPISLHYEAQPKSICR